MKTINFAIVVCCPPQTLPQADMTPVLCRPIVAYPITVALSAHSIGCVFVHTNRPDVAALAASLGAETVASRIEYASPFELAADAFRQIAELLQSRGEQLGIGALLFSHAPGVTPQAIEEGVVALERDSTITAAVSVSRSGTTAAGCWAVNSPGGILTGNVGNAPQAVRFSWPASGENEEWHQDHGVFLTRLISDFDESKLCRKVYGIRQEGALALIYPSQVPAVESWIRASEIDRLFRIRRVRWTQFYDSERAVLSSMQLTNQSSVLDLGSDPGGLGAALHERFGVVDYTIVKRDADSAAEAHALFPSLKIADADIQAASPIRMDGFDLVAALDISDSAEFFDVIIPAAFRQLLEGGTLVFSVRLTQGVALDSSQASHQDVLTGHGATFRRPYIVRNTAAVLSALFRLRPQSITAYGYIGRPALTAVTPLREVCFAVFAVTRGVDKGPAAPRVDLRLPSPFAAQSLATSRAADATAMN